MSGRANRCPGKSSRSRLPQPTSSRTPSRLPMPTSSTSCAPTCPSRDSNVGGQASTSRGGTAKRGNITSVTTKTTTDARTGKSITIVTETYESPKPSTSRAAGQYNPLPMCLQKGLTPPPPRRTPRVIQCPAFSGSTPLEKQVEADLLAQSQSSPDGSARAQGSSQETASAPAVMTEDGPVQGTHQITLEQSVNRSPESEFIKKHMTVLEASQCGCAQKDEYSIQQVERGGYSMQDDADLPLQEIVSVTNTVTIGPDFREQVSTTVYEAAALEEQEMMNPEQVSQMIEEESKDVERFSNLQPPELKGSITGAFGLKKKLQKMKLNPDSVKRLESSVVYPPATADEAQEELQPELMAAIMHTEEQGLNMDSFPNNVYNYLFPDAKDDVVIKINPVAPGIMQNVVVPETTVPAKVRFHAVTRELETVAAEATGCGQKRPVQNLFSQSVLKTGAAPKINNTATRDSPNISAEPPPWGAEMQPMISLVGASPAHDMTDADLVELPSAFYHELENVLEYHLMPEPPQHISRVQLRGSQKPPWFPGYYMALPDNIKVVTSPCEVLPAAWQAVQPDIFSDDSFLIVG